MTRPAELESFNVAHSDDAIMHEVAIVHSPAARALCNQVHYCIPRDTLKDLTLAGHVVTITYLSTERLYLKSGHIKS